MSPSYYDKQGTSLPSIRGGGSRASGAGEGLWLWEGLLSLHPKRHGIHLNLLYHGQQTV